MTEKGEKLVKVFLLSGIFDAPAKSMFQNIIQFNGLYGCSYCLEPGKTYKTSAKGHVHIFPFNFETKTGHAPLRSHRETLKHAKKAQDDVVKTGVVSSHYGIKGITWSMSIPCYDVINGLGLDYLHNTLLGVVKMLMTLWFDKKYKQMPWYIGDSVAKIDLRIKNLRLPNLISRVPRNIQNDFKHFKGSEFRNFLLFYSAPILYDFLPDEYFQNYILLVEAVFLLLKSSISPEDLRNGDKILKHFCVRIARLYGERYQTYNLHNILHMTLTVKQHGPLWAQSAFWYEDYNGDYKHLFHGTQSVNIQIVTNTIVQHKIPEIVRSLAPGSVGYTLYNKMTVRYHQHVQTLGNCISPGIYCVGKQLKANCCPVVNSLINHLFPFAKDMYTFKRICFYGNVIQSQSYQRVFKRNTFTVKYKSRFGISYGFIKYYLNLTSSCQETDSVFVRHYLAVIEVPTILEFNMSDDSIAKLQHMVPVSFKDTTYDVCPIENIMDICCFVSTGYERDYIVEFPNRIERD